MIAPQMTNPYSVTAQITRLYDLKDNGSPLIRSELLLNFKGIESTKSVVPSQYYGYSRSSDRRYPGVALGTPIRNRRQITLISEHELLDLATALDVEFLDPEWLNVNVVIDGINLSSYLPRGTTIRCSSGAVLYVEDQNYPCRGSAAAVAKHCAEPDRILREFVPSAIGKRGLLCSIETPGPICVGDSAQIRIPRQWILQAEEI